MKGKRHPCGPRAPRPNLRAVAFRDPGGVSVVVFEVPAGVTTRSAVVTCGTPRYVNVAGRWKLWPGTAAQPWARSWARPRQLDKVPLAAPAPPPTASLPARFVVGVATWCGWPVDVREQLRAVTGWTKAPGAMVTDVVDGTVVARVESLVEAHGCAGLERCDVPTDGGAACA